MNDIQAPGETYSPPGRRKALRKRKSRIRIFKTGELRANEE
jgi:hypothetical protein